MLLSIIGTEISALTFVGVPALAYTGDWTYLQIVLGAIGGRLLVGTFFVPAFYRQNVVSIYEFLSTAYGPRTRNLAVLVFLVTRTLMSGVRLFAGALILQLALGLSATWAVTLVAVLGLAYTVAGGIRAVIWTEVLQVAVMLVGATAAVVYLLSGLPSDWASVVPPGRFRIFDFSLDPRIEFTFWAGVLGTTLTNTAIFGTDYDMVQRMLTAKDSRRSRLAVVGSGVADVPIALVFLSIGTLLFAYYQLHPDPTLGTDARKVFPHFILTALPPGLSGLLIAAVLSVVLSSYQSALTALAGSFVMDVYQPYLAPGRSQAHYLRATRLSSLGFCFALGAVAVASQNVERLLPLGLEIGTYFYGALLAVFAYALATRRRPPDALAALSLPFSIFAVVALKLNTELAFPWFVSVGALTGLSFLFISARCCEGAASAPESADPRPGAGPVGS